MTEWLESVAGPAYATALLWTLGALILLLAVLVLIKIVRNLTFGTFVAGGRNRKTRLAVMDAAAVDSHRRIVLIRRDDVEHLILIGGPTDVVVEQNIRMPLRPRQTGEDQRFGAEQPKPLDPTPEEARRHEPRPAPVQAPPRGLPREPMPQERPAPAAAPAPATRPASAPAPLPAAMRPVGPALQPMQPARAPETAPRHPPASPAAAARPQPAAPVTAAHSPDLDDALLDELELTLEDRKAHRPDHNQLPQSVEDEMSKLLGELSVGRRQK